MSRPLVAAVVLLVALTTLLSGSGTSSADSPVGKIYFGESGTIMRSNLDGSDVEEIVPEGYSPGDLAIDKVGELIYWTDAPGGRILRADVDGAYIVELITRTPGVSRLTLDGAGKIYWIEREGGGAFDDGTIWRADIDGSSIESVLSFVALRAVAVDPAEGYIYWAGFNAVFRSPLDGSSMEEWAFGSGALIITDLAIDRDTHDVYYVSWTPPVPSFGEHGAAGKIGSDASVAWVYGAPRPFHVALDLEHEHAYWADHGTQQVLRTGLNGADFLLVDSFDCCLGGIAFGPCPAGDSCSPPAPLTPPATLTPTPCPSPEKPFPSGCAVGGVVVDSNLRGLPLETPGSSGRNGGVLAVVIAGIAAVAGALGGAAWYARKRWIGS